MKSKRNLEIETVNYLGVELLIHFEIDGYHIDATYELPCEEPDVLILKVFAGDVDISEILLDAQWDAIYELLNDNLEL